MRVNRAPGFKEEEFRNVKAEGLERSWISAPSTAAIGWIPYYGCAEGLGDSPLRERYERELAVRLLFASGNPEPQVEFPGDVRFVDRLGLGDFRAAIALRRPRLAINAQRQPVALRVGTLYRMGRTPMPIGRDRIQVQLLGREQARGGGRLRPDVRFSAEGVEIRYEYLFKLGWLADLAGAVLTRKLAPFACMELRYSISCSGVAGLEVRSSVVPSICWYGEQMGSSGEAGRWSKEGGTEMENLSAREFGGFVDMNYQERGPRGYPLRATARCFEETAFE